MRQQVNARGGFGVPTNSSANASGHDSFLQRIGLKLDDYASGIELVFANIRNTSGGGLLNGQYPITLTCALEVGADVFPVYWSGGSRWVRIEPGGFVKSLRCPVVLPPGTGTAVLRMHGLWDSAPDDFPIANGAMTDAGLGYDSNSRGVGLADNTLGTMPASINTFAVIFPPWAVIGSTTPAPAVIAIGDSNRGWAVSGLSSAVVPYINLGADGYTLNAFMGNDFPRLIAAEEAEITHALVTVAGGDVTGGAGSATLIARANSVAITLERFGIRPIFATTPPKTNAANTSVNSASIWNAVRDYNAYLRASNGVGYGYFDLFDQWGIRETGLWRTDLGTPTDDGTHANAVMHTAAATALAAALPDLLAT